MLDSDANTEKLRNQLAEAYRKLPPFEQKMVQLFAVIYEPVARTSFLDCLNQVNRRDKNARSLIPKTLKPYLDEFLEAGLLLQERGQGIQCHPLLTEIATRDALRAGYFEMMIEVVDENLPIHSYRINGPRYFTSDMQFMREVRIGFYRQDLGFIYKQLEDYSRYIHQKQRLTFNDICQLICNNPFDREWFSTLNQDLYEISLVNILGNAALKLTPANEAFELLESEFSNHSGGTHPVRNRCTDPLLVLLAEQFLWRGRIQEAQQSIERLSADYHEHAAILFGWISLLRGDYEMAIAYYRDALKSIKKAAGKRPVFFGSTGGLFFILALLKDGSSHCLQEAEEYTGIMARQTEHWLKSTYTLLQSLLKFQQGELSRKESISDTRIATPQLHHSIGTLMSSFCLYWVDVEKAKTRLPKILEPFCEQAEASGYDWLAMEAAELLLKLKPRSKYGKQAATLRQNSDTQALVNLIHPQETWEICLNALSNLIKEPQAEAKTGADQRLVWFVKFAAGRCTIQPREQKINVKGVWSMGRNIALKRLKTDPGEFDYLTPQDLRVCSHIRAYQYGYNGQNYDFKDDTICALVGHPLVFWDDAPTIRVEIAKGEPELVVKEEKGDQVTLQFLPAIKEGQSFIVIKESPTRLKVIQITEEHRRIAEILGKQNRLQVPTIAKERVLTAINAVSGIVTVHSDIGGGTGNAEEMESESKPHIHLLPAGEGLKVAVLARPFGQAGSYYRPGTGGATVITEIDGKRWQTTRNLGEEEKLANAAVAACPTLTSYEEHDGEWRIEDPEACLELLLELQTLEDNAVLEWPEGEKLRISHRADLSNFHMSIHQQRDWFATEGELKLDDRLVLDMQQLMTLLDKTSSRFVPLGDGQFLALTQEFRKRLDELRSFSEKHGKGVRFHPLAAIALEDFMDEVGDLKADKHWKAHIKRLKEMQSLEPQLPSTLQAELRDYQIDGFNWLARLAHWGVGACLADDMGLGKTLQALAVILTRAPEGATLILAPTSVCMNWISEVQKFAPTLNVIQFGSGDRQQTLDNLQPFDMVICSYGLLQQEVSGEMLSKVSWQTIVLDEAQAIKNFATKRSQAAMNLQGSFKIITTGTPIENHLGELWNLFRFINPGLLGSLENFNQRFANPIERSQDKQARNKLKKLIQPFLLRRNKSQVLQELPSRTEILLHVDLSKEEMAFYEALRREAIAKLSESNAEAGHKHLQVLAEIMKLRRACCNARLVTPDIPLPSAKLQLFGEVLGELIENRHKALVFSQFVDHLHIIRAYLDEQKIHYQYLDGSTPANDRKKRVDAFQAGEGDVFLISLKAGGTGLNLTAADYVIHMDPWWNPAVEDQASDRAHRIGQQRPVTIYRLVAKGTIEEKIVNLHQQKRDLADSLLEGADMSGKISTDMLLQLISVG
jgi:SNF2 family DNA or RNA helicase/tetratricopeptide (TPR) repeat protein